MDKVERRIIQKLPISQRAEQIRGTVGSLAELHGLAAEFEEDEANEKKRQRLFLALLHLLLQGPATSFEWLRFVPYGDEVTPEHEAVYEFLTFLKCEAMTMTPGSKSYEEVVRTVRNIRPLELCSLVWGLSRATALRIEPKKPGLPRKKSK